MEKLMLTTSTGTYLIDIVTILRVEASSNYSKIYFSDGKMMVTAKLLSWFEEKLEKESFTRLHRSHLINNRYLHLQNSAGKSVELQNGKIIPVSRRRKKNVLQRLAAACLLSFACCTAISQNVGIGTTTPAAKLHVKGTADTFQLYIDAHTTQSNSNPLIKLRTSGGGDLLWIHSDNPTNSFVGLSNGRINNAVGGGINNTFIGSSSGYSNSTGNNNTAIGLGSLYTNNSGSGNTASGVNSLTVNTTGNWNTANGFQALALNSTGSNNTADGYFSLYSNVAGSNATAIGYQAMRYANNSVTPFTNYNVAVGYESLRGSSTAANNTGTSNTAIGYQTLLNNSTGFSNTAIGRQSLSSNTGGDNNTAIGYQSLFDNTAGLSNTATGFQALFNNTDGDRNTAYGVSALLSNQAGNNGTAFGYGAMSLANNQATPFANTNIAFGYEALRGSVSASANTGSSNSAVGYHSLYSNSSGDNNTAMGYHSLYTNSTGNRNTGLGYLSLNDNSIGSQNTATGWQTLNSNTVGDDNTASGANAMRFNTTGSRNTAIGVHALNDNVAGSRATAVGYYAMFNSNESATAFDNFNVAVGYEALYGNANVKSGNNNTAIGYQSLRGNAAGNYNTGVGMYSLFNSLAGSFNTAIGMYSLYNHLHSDAVTSVGYSAGSAYTNWDGCTFLGYNSETNFDTYENAMAIGYNAVVTGSDRVRIGNSSITSIGGQVGWTTFSDGRFKKNITEDISGLDFISKLRPVSYTTDITALNKFIGVDEIRNIKESRGEKIVQNEVSKQEMIRHTGFIAQEVEKAARELGFKFSGVDSPTNGKDIYGIRYAEFVVPLVKAVQELNQKSEEQLKMIAELKKELEELKGSKQ